MCFCLKTTVMFVFNTVLVFLLQKLKEDVTKFFDENGVKVDIQVHEMGRFVRFSGNHLELVSKFLLSKGF